MQCNPQTLREFDDCGLTYTVVFENSLLGLGLYKTVEYEVEYAELCNVVGHASASGVIHQGDLVFRVNDALVLGKPYDDVMRIVRDDDFPKTIEFVPRSQAPLVWRLREEFKLTATYNPIKFPNSRTPEVRGCDDEEEVRSIPDRNQNAIVKKGRVLLKKGDWRPSYAVLSGSTFEWFEYDETGVTFTTQAQFTYDQGATWSVRAIEDKGPRGSDGTRAVSVHEIEFCLGQQTVLLRLPTVAAQHEWISALEAVISVTSASASEKALPLHQEHVLYELLKAERRLQGLAVSLTHDEARQEATEAMLQLEKFSDTDASLENEDRLRTEQELLVCDTALLLYHDLPNERARQDAAFDLENIDVNIQALKAIRCCMPVDVRQKFESQLTSTKTPSGRFVPREMARHFKRVDVLELLRIDPHNVARIHPDALDHLHMVGLTVTERRALHQHLNAVGAVWEANKQDLLSGRKLDWFQSLERTMRRVLRVHNRHIKRFGSAYDHRLIATSEGPACPMQGKQCALRADVSPAYFAIDLGYPEGEVYPTDPLEAAPLLTPAHPTLDEVVAHLETHYYKNAQQTVDAHNAYTIARELIDAVERVQLQWLKARKASGGDTTEAIEREVDEFHGLLRNISEVVKQLDSRSSRTSGDETRSWIECTYAIMVCDVVVDCLAAFDERLHQVRRSLSARSRAEMQRTRFTVARLRMNSAMAVKTLDEPLTHKVKQPRLRADLANAFRGSV